MKPSIRLDAYETGVADGIKKVFDAITREECGKMRCTCDDGQQCATYAKLIEKLRKALEC